jgi:hypothetical protein
MSLPPKRATAQAQPGVSAIAALAVTPCVASRWHRSFRSAASPWKRCADPATSMNIPSGGSGVTRGE